MQSPQVDAVERDASRGRVVEPRHELGERRLAGAGRAHERDRLPGRDVQLEVRQHDPVVAVGEADVVEVDRALRRPEVDRMHRIGNARLLVEHAGDLLERRRRRLVRVVEDRHLLHRVEEASRVHQDREQRADREPAVDHAESADHDHDRDGHVADQDQARIEDSEQLDHAGVRVAVVLDDVAVHLLVALLLAERLDRADARHGLDELHDEARGEHPLRPEEHLRPLLEPAREQGQRDQRSREHEAAPGVDRHERHPDEPHVEHAADQAADAGVEQLTDRLEVAGLPRDDAPGGVGLVELEAEPLGVQVDAPAQVEQDRLADPCRRHRVLRDEHGAGDAGREVRPDGEDDRHPVVVLHRGREAPCRCRTR